MNEDTQNRFERAQAKPALADDRKNRFQRHDENRAATLRQEATDKATEYAARVEQDKTVWQGSNRTANRVGGTLLDPATAQARKNRDDDLAAGKAVSATPGHPPMSPATMASITNSWLASTPEFYTSDFNRTSMRNFCRMNVEKNNAIFGVELLDAAFRWLNENNHLERDPAIPRKRGDVTSAAAPTIFEYTPSEEREAQQDLAGEVAQSIETSEAERAKGLSFADLHREVKGQRKPLDRRAAAEVAI